MARSAVAPNAIAVSQALSALAIRVHGEYREMPGLRLTVDQAARLFSVAPAVADAVLHELRRASLLACSRDGAFGLIDEFSMDMHAAPPNGSLRTATLGRLTCLSRPWAWADDARNASARELTN